MLTSSAADEDTCSNLLGLLDKAMVHEVSVYAPVVCSMASMTLTFMPLFAGPVTAVKFSFVVM